jgi:hypothetical protein
MIAPACCIPAYMGGNCGISPQHAEQRKNVRLDGGGHRLVRTSLPPNSLLTGKNTGNFADFAALILVTAL